MPPGRGWNVVDTAAEVMGGRLRTLFQEMNADPHAPGFSDIGIRNTLFNYILCLRPESVLEVGMHIGTGAVAMATALSLNGFGHLYSIEPQDVYRQKAAMYFEKAGLSELVTIVPGFSTDTHVEETLRNVGKFELAFIDACHDRQEALRDIEIVWNHLRPNGIVVLHDTSVTAQNLDSRKEGGVRQALLDAKAKLPGFQLIFMEYPLWLNPVGAAVVCKQEL